MKVELILEKLAQGETIEQLLAAHPWLTQKAILAALDFASQALRADVFYPLAAIRVYFRRAWPLKLRLRLRSRPAPTGRPQK